MNHWLSFVLPMQLSSLLRTLMLESFKTALFEAIKGKIASFFSSVEFTCQADYLQAGEE